MGAVKRMMEEVAELDPNDERVKAEVERLLSINHRELPEECES